MPETDAEWREMIWDEIKELRADVRTLMLRNAESRGRRHVITGIISVVVSGLFAVVKHALTK